MVNATTAVKLHLIVALLTVRLQLKLPRPYVQSLLHLPYKLYITCTAFHLKTVRFLSSFACLAIYAFTNRLSRPLSRLNKLLVYQRNFWLKIWASRLGVLPTIESVCKAIHAKASYNRIRQWVCDKTPLDNLSSVDDCSRFFHILRAVPHFP